MKKMPIIFDMTFNKDGEREVLHTIRKEIRDLVNTTLAEGKQIIPTFKRDGTAVFCDADGQWLTRRAVKTGKQAPEGFIALETDPNTGTTFGWEPKESSPMKKFLNKAIEKFIQDNGAEPPRNTTFELLGPRSTATLSAWTLRSCGSMVRRRPLTSQPFRTFLTAMSLSIC